MEQITQEDIAKLAKTVQEAKKEDTPYLAQTNDRLAVVGDVSKVEKKFNDYTIRFRFEKDELVHLEELPKGTKELGNFYIFETTYKDVSVDPINNLKLSHALLSLQPLFQDIKENGDLRDRDEVEVIGIFAKAKKEVIMSIYSVVAVMLNIDDFLAIHMMPYSVMTVFTNIIQNHPELVNEVEMLFG